MNAGFFLDTRRLACVTAAAALAVGCAGAPVTHFHTLLPAAAQAVGASSAIPPAGGGAAWTLAAVTSPAQVNRPQWVVRGDGETLAVLENERWIAPLTDELRAAVTERLATRLGSYGGLPPVVGRTGWQVRIAVQRLDAAPGRYARLDAGWTLGAADAAGAALACRSVFEQPVAGGYAALADGHRGNVARLADAIAAALLAADRGEARACPR